MSEGSAQLLRCIRLDHCICIPVPPIDCVLLNLVCCHLSSTSDISDLIMAYTCPDPQFTGLEWVRQRSPPPLFLWERGEKKSVQTCWCCPGKEQQNSGNPLLARILTSWANCAKRLCWEQLVVALQAAALMGVWEMQYLWYSPFPPPPMYNIVEPWQPSTHQNSATFNFPCPPANQTLGKKEYPQKSNSRNLSNAKYTLGKLHQKTSAWGATCGNFASCNIDGGMTDAVVVVPPIHNIVEPWQPNA